MLETSRSLRVMLVAFNIETVGSTVHRLVSRGHRPLLVEHTAQALQLANQRKLDVALIELGRLGSAADECARALSQLVPGLPLIGLVSRTEPFENRDIAAFGACLMSPLDVDVLEKAFVFVGQVRSSVTGAGAELRSRRIARPSHAALFAARVSALVR